MDKNDTIAADEPGVSDVTIAGGNPGTGVIVERLDLRPSGVKPMPSGKTIVEGAK